VNELRRIAAGELAQQLGRQEILLLDARRAEAFRRNPQGIASAVPVLLDETPLRLPDVARNRRAVVYCLCSGQASSTRVALRLLAAGYRDVAVLDGGLPGWQAQGLPLAEVNLHDRDRLAWMSAPEPATSHAGGLIAESAFLSGEPLPLKREMAVLFVDMVDSTRLLFSHTPEDVLRVVQTFMQVVVDVAVQHCGDVHDFEGDGAMLYFAGSGEAVPAAFDLRKALAAKRHCEPELPQARFALDAGPLVVGRIGSHERRALAFIGPSVNTAARILKLASPGGIVATEAVIAHARRSDPDLAAEFHALPQKQTLKGFDQAVIVYQAAPSQGDAGHICS
jgi:class 3 adenylate cyclase/rhodanese-related sulfurtransferase